MKIKVAWLAPYPVQELEPELKIRRRPLAYHPCSWIVNLSVALANRPDIELHLVTESTLVSRNQTVQRGGITFHVVRQGVPFINRGYPSWFPVDIMTGFRSNAMHLTRMIRAIRPGIVHAHGTEAAYALAGLASGYPCLVSIQGIINEYFETNPDFRFRVVRHLERQAVQQARYFTCRTDFDTGFVRAINPTARIFHIHEAMNPVFFRDPWKMREDAQLLFVGALQERKGLSVLLHALSKVKEAIPAVRLSVIGGGGGKHTQSLRNLVAELGVSSNVDFLGHKTAAEIADWHRWSQLFILPSDNENSPNTLAEAMVSGMPVIATNVGGIPSMVTDGKTGLLMEVRAPEQLAERIIYLLQNPQERRRLGENAHAVARIRHLPTTVADETIKAYQEILNHEKQHPV
jgi:glycosyltransferase involved in cell wall biosynthesis